MPAASATASSSGQPLPFATTETVSDDSGGKLTVTPIAAWWLPGNVQGGKDGTEPAEHGEFLVVEVRATAQAAGVRYPMPATGYGLTVYSNDQVFPEGASQAASNVVWNTCLPVISTLSEMPAQQAETGGVTYDVPSGPALLEWMQPSGQLVKWRVPTKSTAALPSDIQGAISSGNGC